MPGTINITMCIMIVFHLHGVGPCPILLEENFVVRCRVVETPAVPRRPAEATIAQDRGGVAGAGGKEQNEEEKKKKKKRVASARGTNADEERCNTVGFHDVWTHATAEGSNNFFLRLLT